MGDDPASCPPPGRLRSVLARCVAYGLPALLLVVGVVDADLWPATGWRLFSGVREGTQATWIIDATDGEGTVRRHQPEAVGVERREWRHLLDQAAGDQARQRELCEQWLDDAVAGDPSIRQLAVRRAVIEIPRRSGMAAPVTWERVVVTCHR